MTLDAVSWAVGRMWPSGALTAFACDVAMLLAADGSRSVLAGIRDAAFALSAAGWTVTMRIDQDPVEGPPDGPWRTFTTGPRTVTVTAKEPPA